MVDPRMLTEAAHPPYLERKPGLCGWLCAEAWDHLWPWNLPARQLPNIGLRAGSAALAVAVSIAWVLAAMGQLRAGAIIGWWFGWSLLEVMIRITNKPYVKDGPWWGRRYRRASVMDMICYVGFKNLLLGAALYLALRALGRLVG
jgi:hypothetical protein